MSHKIINFWHRILLYNPTSESGIYFKRVENENGDSVSRRLRRAKSGTLLAPNSFAFISSSPCDTFSLSFILPLSLSLRLLLFGVINYWICGLVMILITMIYMCWGIESAISVPFFLIYFSEKPNTYIIRSHSHTNMHMHNAFIHWSSQQITPTIISTCWTNTFFFYYRGKIHRPCISYHQSRRQLYIK